jgi:hypothetical protein
LVFGERKGSKEERLITIIIFRSNFYFYSNMQMSAGCTRKPWAL